MTDGSTPLIALDAAVIDTETTGLDPRTARVVELAMVCIAGGRLEGTSFRWRWRSVSLALERFSGRCALASTRTWTARHCACSPTTT